jgi:cation:H+ antiporter
MTFGAELLLSLVLILAAAEIFTNALEHLGERLGISEGVTGSLLAAVGTAMPESIVPIVAVFAGTTNAELNADIGLGAILGAPLMLSTLSLALMALSVLRQRGVQGHLRPERSGLQRDLMFFLIAFGIGLFALLIPDKSNVFRYGAAFALVMTYVVYVLQTLKVSAQLVEDGHGVQAHRAMFLCRLGLPNNALVIIVQLGIGLAILITGAKGFVHCVEAITAVLPISPLLLALLVIPVATELPEQLNSLLWIRRGKDTLAFGNITGAMVFQGSLLPALGLLLTPWVPTTEVLLGVIVAFGSGAWLYLLARQGGLRVWHLFINGAIYVIYVIAMLAR